MRMTNNLGKLFCVGIRLSMHMRRGEKSGIEMGLRELVDLGHDLSNMSGMKREGEGESGMKTQNNLGKCEEERGFAKA